MRKKPELSPPGPDDVVLSLQQACKTEIDGAVDLFIRHQNLAGAHVLASAAHEIIRGVAKREGVLLPNDMPRLLSSLDKKKLEAVLYALNHPYNALKHTNGDRNSIVHFNPEFFEITLLMACVDYQVLFRDLSVNMMLYKAWVIPRHNGKLLNFTAFDLKGFKVTGDTLTDALADVRGILLDIDENPDFYAGVLAKSLLSEYPNS
jgi:hypothetical protein